MIRSTFDLWRCRCGHTILLIRQGTLALVESVACTNVCRKCPHFVAMTRTKWTGQRGPDRKVHGPRNPKYFALLTGPVWCVSWFSFCLRAFCVAISSHGVFAFVDFSDENFEKQCHKVAELVRLVCSFRLRFCVATALRVVAVSTLPVDDLDREFHNLTKSGPANHSHTDRNQNNSLRRRHNPSIVTHLRARWNWCDDRRARLLWERFMNVPPMSVDASNPRHRASGWSTPFDGVSANLPTPGATRSVLRTCTVSWRFSVGCAIHQMEIS